MTISGISIIIAITIVSLVWLASAIYAFWRVGRLTQNLRGAKDQSLLASELLRADGRSGLWLWANGNIIPMEGAAAQLGIGHLDRFSDLIAYTDSAKITFPDGRDAKNVFNSLLLTEPFSEHHFELTLLDNSSSQLAGDNSERTLNIHFQPLAGLAPRFPIAVLWVMTKGQSHNHFITGDRGARSRLFQANPVPSAVFDYTAKILEANDAYTKAVGARSPDEAVSQKLDLWERKPTALFEDISNTQLPVRDKVHAIIGRERRNLALELTPIDGQRLLATFIDITAEEEISAELGRLIDSQSETLNRLRTPVAIFGADQSLRFFNDAFIAMSHLQEDWLASGIDHSELLDAMRARRRVPEQINFQGWKATKLNAYTSLVEAEEELWHLSDGSSYRIVSQPYPFGGLLILMEDFTDRLTLERNYNTLIAAQNGTIENLRDAIAVFTPDTAVKLLNPAFLKMWGMKSYNLNESLSAADFMPAILALWPKEEARDKQRKLFLQTVPTIDLPAWVSENVEREGRVTLTNKKTYDYRVGHLQDGNIMIVFDDVTDSFKVELALRERASALEAADRMKDQFMTSMSYELRTPLNSIIGFAEMMQMGMAGEMPDRARDYINNILSGAGRLKDMISDVLDLAILEAGDMQLDLEEINLASVLMNAEELAREMCLRAGSSLEAVFDKTIILTADKRRIKQVYLNLVSAVLVIAPYGHLIRASIYAHSDKITLMIGCPDTGLDSDNRDRLIQSLQTGNLPANRRTTGLDLALAKSIISLHGGSLSINSFSINDIMICVQLDRNVGSPDKLQEASKYNKNPVRLN